MRKYTLKGHFLLVMTKVLDLEDDAAHVNWGGGWRMPTIEELEELRTKCTWIWGSQNGVNGHTVVGPNSNSLFLPAEGARGDIFLIQVGTNGSYWSSSLNSDTPCSACSLTSKSSSVQSFSDNNHRYFGYAIRPVCP